MAAGRAAAQHRRGGRLHTHHPDGGVLAFQVPPHPGDGAAGADARHKKVHLAVGVLPDLGAGGGLVGRRVGRVVELPRHKGPGYLGGQLVGAGNGPAHPLAALGQHQLGAVGFHQQAALQAHGLGHHDDHPVAPGRAHAGQPDAGVARRGLDDDRPRLQQALGLGVVQHGPGHPVLDRAAGVHGFDLGQDARLQLFAALDVGQLQQGGVADQLLGRRIDLAHGTSSSNLSTYLPGLFTGIITSAASFVNNFSRHS